MVARHRLVIAGGLGSGKSRVGSLLAGLGWAVVDTDQIGHEVLLEKEIVAKVGKRWPEVVTRGSVDRATLAGIVFPQPNELASLEAIIHPEVAARVTTWLSSAGNKAAVEVSVLKVVSPEWGKVVVVTAPVGLRIERAVSRGIEPQDVKRRIERQPEDSEYLKRANFVIDNAGSEESLANAVARLDTWANS